jgi:uncharacterized protein (TIGR00290 family)
MSAARKAALLWSGGKDSALALHHVRENHPELDVVKLVTCVSQAYDRVSMHGVRRQLIAAQADALGLPLEIVVVASHPNDICPVALNRPGTDFPPNDVYSRTILAALDKLKQEGIEVVVFGDIYLEDLRAYRDGLLAHAGLEGAYPLWGRDPAALYDEMCRLGYQAVTVCVDGERLSEAHCGQILTQEFRDSLPVGVDVCGERGEYHSFVFDGPSFRQAVPWKPGEVHQHAPFFFQELYPGDGEGVIMREQFQAAELPR